jgi:hypothetical protein
MANDTDIDNSDNVEDIASKLEELAGNLRQGCVTPNTMQLVTSFSNALLGVTPQPTNPSNLAPQVLFSLLASHAEDSESDEDGIIDGEISGEDITQYLFRGWFLTMMMNAINSSEEDVNEVDEEVDEEIDGEIDGEETSNPESLNDGNFSYFSSVI